MDREKVIKKLTVRIQSDSEKWDTIELPIEQAKDILALLKEQEAKPVKVVKIADDYKLYYCPRCDRPFCDFYYVKPKFCDKCGQELNWNERR